MADTPILHAISAGGLAATHRPPAPFDVIAAPSTGKQRNTLRRPLLPVASWRIEDINFAFDSSFITPGAFDAAQLQVLLERHPGAKLAVFGHADPVGQDSYNKTLSGRRALAVYGLLTRAVERWEELYKEHDTQGKDPWTPSMVQVMLNWLGFDTGRRDGVVDEATRSQTRAFQQRHGVAPTGIGASGRVDVATFRALALAYMDSLALGRDGKPFKVSAGDFLAAGGGKDLKADVQGCGEFNPVLLFSQAEKARLDADENRAERNRLNRPNRRVMVLLFEPDVAVDPARWPCPTYKEGVAGCRKRFWSDGDQRRSNGPEQREYRKTQDTFACRFHHRISVGLPESDLMVIKLQLHDALLKPCGDTPYTLALDIGGTIEGKTRADGWLYLAAPKGCRSATVTYTPKDQDAEYVVTAALTPPDAPPDRITVAHIRNFGFGRTGESDRAAIVRFQAARVLELTGEIDDATRAAVNEILARSLHGVLGVDDDGE